MAGNPKPILDHLENSIASTLQSMTGQEFTVAADPQPVHVTEFLPGEVVWQQTFSNSPDQPGIWISAPQETWGPIGDAVFKSPRMGTSELHEQREIWGEIINQTASSTANSVSSDLKQEITSSTNETQDGPLDRPWTTFTATGPDGQALHFRVAVADELANLYLQQAQDLDERQAAALTALNNGQVTIADLQTGYGIASYDQAAQLVEHMERLGIIGPEGEAGQHEVINTDRFQTVRSAIVYEGAWETVDALARTPDPASGNNLREMPNRHEPAAQQTPVAEYLASEELSDAERHIANSMLQQGRNGRHGDWPEEGSEAEVTALQDVMSSAPAPAQLEMTQPSQNAVTEYLLSEELSDTERHIANSMLQQGRKGQHGDWPEQGSEAELIRLQEIMGLAPTNFAADYIETLPQEDQADASRLLAQGRKGQFGNDWPERGSEAEAERLQEIIRQDESIPTAQNGRRKRRPHRDVLHNPPEEQGTTIGAGAPLDKKKGSVPTSDGHPHDQILAYWQQQPHIYHDHKMDETTKVLAIETKKYGNITYTDDEITLHGQQHSQDAEHFSHILRTAKIKFPDNNLKLTSNDDTLRVAALAHGLAYGEEMGQTNVVELDPPIRAGEMEAAQQQVTALKLSAHYAGLRDRSIPIDGPRGRTDDPAPIREELKQAAPVPRAPAA